MMTEREITVKVTPHPVMFARMLHLKNGDAEAVAKMTLTEVLTQYVQDAIESAVENDAEYQDYDWKAAKAAALCFGVTGEVYQEER